MLSSRGSSPPRVLTSISCIPCIEGEFFTSEPPGKPIDLVTYEGKESSVLLLFVCLFLVLVMGWYRVLEQGLEAYKPYCVVFEKDTVDSWLFLMLISTVRICFMKCFIL